VFVLGRGRGVSSTFYLKCFKELYDFKNHIDFLFDSLSSSERRHVCANIFEAERYIILTRDWQYLSGESVLYLTHLTAKFKNSSFITLYFYIVVYMLCQS